MQHFFLPGVRKSGTTFLYQLLDQHPDICMSRPKEPLFFEAEYEKGITHYRQEYFSHCKDGNITGDACSRLLMLPFVPERIHARYPNARFVIVLRNPVTRAYSHWWGNYANSVEPLPFDEALRRNQERLERNVHFEGETGKKRWKSNALHRERKELIYRYYLDLGYYAQQLERWFEIFDREACYVLIFEELINQPENELRRIWDFLGVSSDVKIKSTRPRMVGLGRLGSVLGSIGTRMNLSERLPDTVKSWVGYGLSLVGDNRPDMSTDVRHWLTNHYRSSVDDLTKMIDFDHSQWLDFESLKRE